MGGKMTYLAGVRE